MLARQIAEQCAVGGAHFGAVGEALGQGAQRICARHGVVHGIQQLSAKAFELGAAAEVLLDPRLDAGGLRANRARHRIGGRPFAPEGSANCTVTFGMESSAR